MKTNEWKFKIHSKFAKIRKFSKIYKIRKMTILKLCHESYQSQRSVRESVNVTLTISLVLSSENLTPRRTPAITMAVTTAHVTAMITCFRVTRDFLSSPASRLGSTCTTLKITNINNSGLDKDICIKFYGKMHRGHAEMTT